MGTRSMRMCTVALLLAAGSACTAVQPSDSLHQHTGEAPGMIQIDVAQDGFAGQTGHRWTLEQDGRLSVARIGPRDQYQPQGVWPVSQARLRSITRLAEALCNESPPVRLGGPVTVNPVTVVFRSPRCETRLVLPAGTDPVATAAAHDDPHRVATDHLLALVREFRQERKPEP